MLERDQNNQRMLDSILWKSFLKGEEDAFKIIYKTHVKQLFEYGLNFTNDKDLIHDHIHDVFVNLHKYRKKIKETNNIRLYLLKTLKHSLLKGLKQTQKVSHPEHFEHPSEFEKSSEDLIIEKDTKTQYKKQIRQALSTLSDRQREALFLKFYLEYNYDNISEIMDINYQSARNLVHRSLEKLRETF